MQTRYFFASNSNKLRKIAQENSENLKSHICQNQNPQRTISGAGTRSTLIERTT
jgi:hypothetical protein